MFHVQKKMLEESKKMVVDADNRLGKVVGDLRDLVVSGILGTWAPWLGVHSLVVQVRAKKEPAMAEDEELLKAEEALEEVSV